MQIRLNRNVAAGRREHQYSQQSRAKSSHGQLGKNLVISGSSKTFIPASASKQKQHASAMQAHLVPHDKAHVSQFQHFNQHRLISKEMVKQQQADSEPETGVAIQANTEEDASSQISPLNNNNTYPLHFFAAAPNQKQVDVQPR